MLLLQSDYKGPNKKEKARHKPGVDTAIASLFEEEKRVGRLTI